MNGKVALDTNVAIAVLNGEETVVTRLRSHSGLCLPLPVVGELLFGALNSQRAEANLERVNRLLQSSQILNLGSDTASLYARTRLALKQKGRPIPENDVWIAASCLEQQLPLVTTDTHFTWVDGMTVDLIGLK